MRYGGGAYAGKCNTPVHHGLEKRDERDELGICKLSHATLWHKTATAFFNVLGTELGKDAIGIFGLPTAIGACQFHRTEAQHRAHGYTVQLAALLGACFQSRRGVSRYVSAAVGSGTRGQHTGEEGYRVRENARTRSDISALFFRARAAIFWWVVVVSLGWSIWPRASSVFWLIESSS